jgi:TolB-like protein/Flp pilus assembly protein TadD
MSGSSLFQEMKRRHVYRVAVAYVVTSWLLVQLASILLPTFGAPAWVLKVVVGLLGLFFPVALLLAWAFEITPEGVRRTVPEGAEAARPVEAGRRVGRSLNIAIIAGLAVAVAVLAWGRFGPGHVTPAGSGAAASPSASALLADSVPARSIAVLPFANLSTDSANAFFATGMQDMILTKLAGMGDLKVISRTSTERYGHKPQDLKGVGRELGVATVLEGSVQRSGQQVLINVQLIDTRTDQHLWANYYTRTLDNVFGVEGEVAGKVADALQARLTPSERERVIAPPTTNPTAYELYLKADAHFRRAEDNNSLVAQDMPPAIRLYEQALARDSTFALAWAGLAQAHMNMYFFAPDRTASRLAAAKAAADRSLALKPDLGEGHEALALYEYWGHRNYDAAVAQLELARASLPNSASIEVDLAAILRRQGAMEKAVAAFRRATLLDPRNLNSLGQLALTYQMLRRYDAADSAGARALAIGYDTVDYRIDRGINEVLRSGDLGPIRAAVSVLEPGSSLYASNVETVFYVAFFGRDFAAAIRVARSDTSTAWTSTGNVALPRLLFVARAQEGAGDSAAARQSYAAARSAVRQDLQRRSDDPDLHLALGLSYAGLGGKDEALKEGQRAAELMPVSRDAVTGPEFLYWNAWIDAQVGEKAKAIAVLRQFLQLPTGGFTSPALLRIDPTWDVLRKEPGFQALTRQTSSPLPVTSSAATEEP